MRFLLLITLLVSCATVPKGSVKEERAHIERMSKNALMDLYKEYPKLENKIKKSYGYAVFSNIHTNIIFATTNGGYGVAINNQNKKKTFMEMFGGGLGIGLGLAATRIVFIFEKKHDFENLVDNGWEFGVEASAAAKLDDAGGEATGIANLDSDILVYTLTKSGIAVEASIEGTKFWVSEDLK